MSRTYAETLAEVRGKRQFVARVANELNAVAKHDVSLLKAISWDSLVNAPQWCLMEFPAVKTLRDACGVIYWLPRVQGSVDGATLMRFSQIVGQSLFDELFHMDIEDHRLDIDVGLTRSAWCTEHYMRSAGSAVLLALTTDEKIGHLYQNVLLHSDIKTDQKAAQAVYKYASPLALSADFQVCPLCVQSQGMATESQLPPGSDHARSGYRSLY